MVCLGRRGGEDAVCVCVCACCVTRCVVRIERNRLCVRADVGERMLCVCACCVCVCVCDVRVWPARGLMRGGLDGVEA